MLSNDIPTNEQYARDIRADRLRELYQQIAFIGIAMLIIIPVYGAIGAIVSANVINIVMSGLAITTGLFITHRLFDRNKQIAASWAFAATIVIVICAILYTDHIRTIQVVPFLVMVLAFPISLLLDTRARYIFITGVIVAILAAPIIFTGRLVIYPHQLAAIIGITMALYLAERSAQEMVEMTGWALETYRHERRTHDELFEQREALQRTVVRSEILAKEMARSNKDLSEALNQAEEAATKRGQFLANMSHELRTPLNAIIGFSETMIKFPSMYNQSELPPVYERDVSQIYSSGRQLLHIVNDILDLNRVDAGELEVRQERVSLDELIHGVTAIAKGLIGSKPVKLYEELPDPLPMAYADESRVRQVLLNLYSNAVKYTDEGFIRLTVRAADDEVEFKLQDTGHGIPKADHDKLFNQFEQAANKRKDPRSGTGLGLAICKELVTLMSGDIWFESDTGEGSTFYFTVPRYRGEETTTPSRFSGVTFFDDDKPSIPKPSAD